MHREGGPGRARRFFEHGDLRLVVLRLLAERPRHGYDIIKDIGEMVGYGYSPSPGVIYPTLTLLEELGQAEVQASQGARKLYAITEDGRRALEESAPVVEALFARIEAAGARRARSEVPQILRAMENLKTALRLRLGGTPPTEAQVQAIAAAMDRAALEIERA